MNLLGGCLAQKVNEKHWEAKTEQRLVCWTESNMKRFHRHFKESLLEGLKDEVKWIGEDGVNFLSI